jgi:hypothetical protein
MKSTRFATLCVALGLVSFSILNSHAQITIDGTRDAGYNARAAIQTTPSSWGGGNTLASLSFKQDGATLNVFLAGRADGNCVYLFVDSKSGGANKLVNNLIIAGTSGDEWRLNNFGTSATAGMTFESGFEADYAIGIEPGGWTHLFPIDLTTPQSRQFIGNCLNTNNAAGGPVALLKADPSINVANASTHVNGFEFALNLSSLGVPSGATNYPIKFMALIINGGVNYMGNQTLGSLPGTQTTDVGGWGNFQALNFEALSGVQTVTINVDNADFDGDGIADGTDTDDDNDGLLDAVETGTGIWVSSSDTGTNPKSVDTDGDGLNDGVETNTGTYVGVTDTGSNPLVADDYDRDMLPDFQDTDDDNDNLADTVETNTGNWVSSANTGTNPRNADTDGDGLRDNVETNTGAYVSAADTGSSPLAADQARVFLVGNDVLFPGGSWQVDNTNNLLSPAVGGPYNIKSITRFIASPTNNIEFKFTGGNWDLNWGIGSNGVTVLNTNTGAISGTLFKDKTPTADDRTINVNIGRARGEYVFTFNDATNSLEFSVTRKSYSTLADYVVGYNLTGANAEAAADQDGDTLDNQAEFTANTAPDSMDTDGDGVNDNDELGATYGFATNPTLPDSDGDGLRDLWELTNNLNPLVATGNDGANGDPDNDGSPNILEQANGTDPNAAGTGFSSPYAKITIPGSFTGWNVNGNWENTMKLVGNNSWRALVFVSTNTMAATNQFKFAPGSYTGSWGRGPSANVAVQNASENLLTTVLNTNGYYRFDFNDFSGAFSITAVSGGTDANTNGLPDAYEAWYGGQLTPAVTTLDPAGDPDGDGVTTADEFAAGSNPVLDVAAPVITLVGDETLVLAQNGTYVDPGVAVTDDRTNGVTVSTNTSQLNPALKGIYPVTYVATDAAGNSTTNNQRFVVVGDWIDGYPSPIFYNLQIIGSSGTWNRNVTNNQAQGIFEVYAQYYRRGATEGTNKTDSKASCWIGVTTNGSATNDLTSGDWTWTAATLNAGNNSGNDEYKVTYTNLAPGTYQVVSRWQFDGGIYGYGGINEDNAGGALGRTTSKVVGTGTNAVTNQIAYLPGSITLTAVNVGYANVQWPPNGTIDTAGTLRVFAQAYSGGVTDASTNAPTYTGFKAQIGYSAGNNDPTVSFGLFTWVDVTSGGYNGANGNNDEYYLDLSGASLGAGTYYYASRFSVDGGATWVYGGIKADGTGNGIWDGTTNANGTLTVTAAGSTFSGAYAGRALTEIAPNGLTYLVNYAFGGSDTTAATLPVQDTSDPNKLKLIVVVRTDDPSLTVGGQTSTSLTSGWSASGVTVADGDNTGLPADRARKVISVDRGTDPKKFIRVSVTK